MRAIRITEQFGLYKLEADGWTTTGATLESVLHKAFAKQAQRIGGPVPLSSPALEVRNPHEMAEVLETLLGPKTDGGGQLHEGVLST